MHISVNHQFIILHSLYSGVVTSANSANGANGAFEFGRFTYWFFSFRNMRKPESINIFHIWMKANAHQNP